MVIYFITKIRYYIYNITYCSTGGKVLLVRATVYKKCLNFKNMAKYGSCYILNTAVNNLPKHTQVKVNFS